MRTALALARALYLAVVVALAAAPLPSAGAQQPAPYGPVVRPVGATRRHASAAAAPSGFLGVTTCRQAALRDGLIGAVLGAFLVNGMRSQDPNGAGAKQPAAQSIAAGAALGGLVGALVATAFSPCRAP